MSFQSPLRAVPKPFKGPGTAAYALLAAIPFLIPTASYAGEGIFGGLFDGRIQMPGIKTFLLGGAAILGGFLLFRTLGGAGAGGFLKGLFSLKGLLIGGAVIGGGLLLKSVFEGQMFQPAMYGRYDQTFGQRYQDPYYSGVGMNPNLVPRVGAGGTYLGDRYGSGNPYTLRSSFPNASFDNSVSIADQIKMTVSGGSYTPSAYMGGRGGQPYGGMGMYGSVAGYGGGYNAGYGGAGTYGNPYMNYQLSSTLQSQGLGMNNPHVANGNVINGQMANPYGYRPPEAGGAVDKTGRVPLAQDALTAANQTSLYMAAAPSDTAAPEDLQAAQDARNQAYDELVSALTVGSSADTTAIVDTLAGYESADSQVRDMAAAPH